ncbi:hypothetical protein B484DRAFT_424362 [Ochromonadaceae sp. CCMP2298]|nr:hypothetical protein B484DRAFT_424362 [Ochromonadaceae sp. CCMP2298]
MGKKAGPMQLLFLALLGGACLALARTDLSKYPDYGKYVKAEDIISHPYYNESLADLLTIESAMHGANGGRKSFHGYVHILAPLMKLVGCENYMEVGLAAGLSP